MSYLGVHRLMTDKHPNLDKQSHEIRLMFAGIAHRYDLLNRILSGWVDTHWRRLTVRLAPPTIQGPVLDVCTGTGDLVLGYQRKYHDRLTIGTDFCREMLHFAHKKALAGSGPKPLFLEADTMVLPMRDNHFALTTVAFGLRNTQDPRQALKEMCRVTRPGGRLAVLEFSMPTWPVLGAVYSWYFQKVLPKVGQTISRSPATAYGYLPQSVKKFPQGEDLCSWIRGAGWESVTHRPFTMGIATLYTANKPSVG